MERSDMLSRRPVWVEIDLNAIKHNIKAIKKFLKPDTLFMAIVKADAYGHGAKKIAQTAIESGADRLGVALVEEAVELRESGINVPIHILSEPPPSYSSLISEYDFIPSVCSFPVAKAISESAVHQNKEVKIHIKVDTGMNRLGLFPEETISFIRSIENLPGLKIEGVFTHFAAADQPENNYTAEQLKKFNELITELKKENINIPIIHAANSAAAIFFDQSHYDMVRIGIALYGLHPSDSTKRLVDLRPALSFKTRISCIKNILAGNKISYGLTYTAPKDTAIAILPLGYADGYTRLFSNKSQVLVSGKRVNTVGVICMDQFMVDIGEIDNVKVGDEVILIGNQGSETIPCDELAGILKTINYEIVCMISRRVPRVYV
ncbi:MAG: alanine racemase [Actinobacteria bacterium]|nr:alanine racemase [Actinomycetota bacterium]